MTARAVDAFLSMLDGIRNFRVVFRKTPVSPYGEGSLFHQTEFKFVFWFPGKDQFSRTEKVPYSVKFAKVPKLRNGPSVKPIIIF